MGKKGVAVRGRRRSASSSRRAPIFPAQRRAAKRSATTETITERAGRLPRPVIWLLWLLGAALLSVVVGFVLGLAQPRTRN